MTQRNIDIMDRIVDEMLAGKKLSEALKTVYSMRNVSIPFCDEMFDISVLKLGLPNRTINALMRNKLTTINDIIEYSRTQKLTNANGLGVSGAIEVLDMILDVAWDAMDKQERVEFLMDVVQKNQGNIYIN